MATVPEVTGPSVRPQGMQPYESIPSSAEDFGAGLGQALARLGGSEKEAADMLQQHQLFMGALNNKAQADAAASDYTGQADQIVTDYKTNQRGGNALPALNDTITKLQELRKTTQGTLENPIQQEQFNSDSRRVLNAAISSVSSHASTEQNRFVKESSISRISSAAQAYASNPSEEAEINLDTVAKKESMFLAKMEGMPDEVGETMYRKNISQAYVDVARSMAANADYDGAKNFLTDRRDRMDPKMFSDMMIQLRPGLIANDVAQLADQSLDQAKGTPNTDRAMKFLMGHGLDRAHAAALAGNFMEESNLQENPKGDNDGGHAYGIGQWHEDRQKAFEAWSGKSIKDSTLEEQLAFSLHELKEGDFKEAGAKFFASKDMKEMMGTLVRGYELPADQSDRQVNARLAHAQSIAAGSVASMSGGPMTSVQLKELAPKVLANARDNADRLHPGDAEFQDRVEQRSMGQLQREISVAQDREWNAYQQAFQAIDQNGIEDSATLLKQPGMADAWNTLPLAYRRSLDSYMKQKATAITPEREMEIARLNGLKAEAGAGVSQDFLKEDVLADSNLPMKDRLRFAVAQSQMRAHQYQAEESDRIANKWMHDPSVVVQLQGMGAKNSRDPIARQFQGVLTDRVHAWEMTNQKVPTDADMKGIVAGAAAQYSALRKGVSPSFVPLPGTVPPSFAQQIRAKYPQATDADIETIYRNMNSGQ